MGNKTADTINAAMPAIVQALGLATSILQSVQGDEDDEVALARLDAQVRSTDQALDDLRAKIAAKRAEGGA